MTLHELDTVVLNRDLPAEGLRRGDIGAVVHLLSDDHFEVEFTRASGRHLALVELSSDDLRLMADNDVLAVRPAGPSVR